MVLVARGKEGETLCSIRSPGSACANFGFEKKKTTSAF